MRSFFRFLLRSLVLLVVALVSMLTAMRFAIHGEEAPIPNLVGKNPVEAHRLAEASGFLFEIEREYYSAEVPAGRILSQLPLAGTRVRRGWQIRVAESLGPQRVQIPDVLGQSERAAEMNIQRRSLDVGPSAELAWPDVSAGQVLSQSPPANASGVSAPKISLLVAAAQQPQTFVMPSFIGRPFGSARSTLQSAGMQVGNVTVAAASSQPASGVPVGGPSAISVIVSQTPAPGEKVTAGSSVNFQVR